jgi:signal recognition particle GTPase
MGAALSRSLAKIFGSKEMRLLMLGLDAAGKTSTSALCKLNRGHVAREAHVSRCSCFRLEAQNVLE